MPKSRRIPAWGGQNLIKNIIYRIAIPSLIFSTIEFFPKKIIRGEAIEYQEMIVETVGGCTFWFTSALVIAEILFLLLFLIRSKNILFYIVGAFLIASVGLYYRDNSQFFLGNENFPWFYAKGMVAMIYLAIGGLYWRYEHKVELFFGQFNNFSLIIAILALFVFAIIMVECCELGLFFTIASFIRNILGVLFVIRVSMAIKECKWLAFIGVNSLGFYLLSGAIPNIFSIIVNHTSIPTTIHLGLVYLLSLAFVYVVVKVFVKYIPWVYDLRMIR